MIIHRDFDMGAVEAWKGIFDPESIAVFPDNVLVKKLSQGETIDEVTCVFC